MISFNDQLGRVIQFEEYPTRIVSLVPSQTELLFDLGLEDEVVGITKFCVHPPEWFRNKTRVGGTKNVRMDVIRQLGPDLIIANKEENTKHQIEELAKHYPVFISDVHNLQTALQMIILVGELTNTAKKAHAIANRIQNDFNSLLHYSQKRLSHKPQTVYLIWKGPYMAAGGDTFINAMLNACGLKNVFEHLGRYPVINIEELQTSKVPGIAGCELLLLSSEPYPFNEKHVEELQSLFPGTKIMLVDGEMFSWYGSRLLHAVSYFKSLRLEL
jgi:ABC-type Fe3+-hydroxamate transport system substrate-binding protein